MSKVRFTPEDFAINTTATPKQGEEIPVFSFSVEHLEAMMAEDKKAAFLIEARIASVMLGKSVNKITDDGAVEDELLFPDFTPEKDGITSNRDLMIAMITNLSPQTIINFAVASVMDRAEQLAGFMHEREMMTAGGDPIAALARMLQEGMDEIDGTPAVVEEGTAEDVSDIKA